MASRPNPLEPVIVNVSTLGVNVPADYTRVFGIVSYGDTGLEANTLKKVQRSTISDLQLKEDSYTEAFLNSYFGNNARGELYILETKAQEQQTIKQYIVGDYFVKDATAYKCLQNDTATSLEDLTPTHLLEPSYWEETAENKDYAVDDLYTTNGKTYKCIQADTSISATDLTPTNLTNTSYWTDITADIESEAISNAVKVLSDFVNTGKVRVYEWACPTVFYDNEDFINLVKSFASITAGQYFSIELPSGTNPTSDPTFALYTKSKSFIPVYPSSVSSESVNGAIVAIKSGSLYDLTSNNPLSPLQWKYAVGITPQDELTNNLLDALNQNGCNWVGTSLNNICVLGGMVGDGKSWEYYFALDTFIYQLIAGMGTRLISGSNAPSTAITFDQNGIDQVRDKLVAISTNMVALKVLLEFGSDYDATNRLILNVGEWNIVDYVTYKSTQNEDWTNGMYNGASCYANIGKFILQVQPNITIE
ncbi:carbohydrate-binding protein [Brachyspira innocens]|uniref:carbohydrate-binding protein n=1 Tax=Brachyspira innocens TaxID=13264 RepID=UPI0026EFF04D|nr:carbohydrate-binding protein [Brachyspira innocens]